MQLLFLALLMVILNIDCAANYVKVSSAQINAGYFDQIAAYNQAVHQVKASLDIKAYGILGSALHEQADVIVRSPYYLYWSLRSFFGPPSLLFASNGDFLTVFDFSGHSNKTYQKIPLNHDSFLELLDFKFHPQSLIDILLAKVPLGNEANLRVSTNKIEITSELGHGWRIKSIFDHQHNRLLETQISNQMLEVVYHAKYDNFTKEGISFPHSLVLLAKGSARFLRLHIEFTNIEINGEPVLPAIFYLEP